MNYNAQTYRIENVGGTLKIALIAGVVGLLLSTAGYFVDSKQFFFSYLTAYLFWISLGLGALFFTMLHHLTQSTWSVVIRRLTESMMMAVPWMAIFFLPLIPGLHDLYHWSHAETVAHDAILAKKTAFLNVPFFLIRAAIYFGVWLLLTRLLFKKSIAQDNGESNLGFLKVSAPGMIAFAFTVTFAAFDWSMSLNPHWYSTIYGVGYFCGAVMGMLALLAILLPHMQSRGILAKEVTVEHYHDLGKLMFAFLILWAYMSFSQYFLIWYANIPEETIWYHHRWTGSWKIVSLLIVFGHFVLPFFAMITRPAKRNPKYLMGVGVWLLFIHWVDMYWHVMPNMDHTVPQFSWMHITTMLGLGGIFMWLFWKRLSAVPVTPYNDPKFGLSVGHVNHF